MEQMQHLIKIIKAVMNERPQPPNTKGMSKEKAAKLKKQHANAFERWQQQLVGLENKLAVLQKKLSDAEKELNRLKISCQEAQVKEKQTQQTVSRIKPKETTTGVSKSVIVNRKILNIQAQSKNLQKEATQILKRIRTLLR